MLRKHLLLFCVGLFLQTNAQTITGLDASKTTMFYATATDLYAQALTGGNQVQKNFRNDTLFNQYLLKIADNYGLEHNTKNLDRLNDFTVMNLTWNNNKLYMCFRYLQDISPDRQKPKFGIIAFDEKLNAVNYFSVQMDTGIAFLNIWPYHPLEFKDDSTIYLQYFYADLYMGEFKLNSKKHRVIRTKQTIKIHRRDSLKLNFLSNPGYMMSPAIYMVPQSNNRFSFIHPFPVIYNTANGKVQADPFSLQPIIRNIYNSKEPTTDRPDLSTTLGFGIELSADKNHGRASSRVMTSRQWNDTIFAIVSTSEANGFHLLFFGVNDKICNIYELKVAAGGKAYFILRRNRLYQLNFKDSKGIITSRVLKRSY